MEDGEGIVDVSMESLRSIMASLASMTPLTAEEAKTICDRIDKSKASSLDMEEAFTLIDSVIDSDAWRSSQEATLIIMTVVRKLLSIETNPPIDLALELGKEGHPFIGDAIALIADTTQPKKLRFEAAWVVTNVASGTGEQTRFVVEHRGSEALLSLLAEEDKELLEQGAWGLGNIAGDSVELRNQLLHMGAVQAVMTAAPRAAEFGGSVLQNFVWMTSNLCRGKPSPEFALIEPLIPIVVEWGRNHDDMQVVIDAMWACSYISDTQNNHSLRKLAMSSTGHVLLQTLTRCLHSSSPKVQTPALRAIGNFVAGPDDVTDLVLSTGVLESMKRFVTHYTRSMRKEACWMLSNVTAGTPAQVLMVMAPEAGFVPLIQTVLRKPDDVVSFREAVWVPSNAVQHYNGALYDYLIECGLVGDMIEVIQQRVDSKSVDVAFDFIKCIVSAKESRHHANFIARAYPKFLKFLRSSTHGDARNVLEELQPSSERESGGSEEEEEWADEVAEEEDEEDDDEE